MDEYKFLNDEEREMFEWELKQSGSFKDMFIRNRKELVGRMKDYKKSKAAERGWKGKHYTYLKGIKRFHRSTRGKKFHRLLGRYLSGRLMSRRMKSENFYDLGIALSSVMTHALLEKAYYMPDLTEAVEYEEFSEFVIPEISRILLEIDNGEYQLENHADFLLRLVHPSVLIEELAEELQKPVEEIKERWEKIVAAMNKSEEEDGYYTELFEKFRTSA